SPLNVMKYFGWPTGAPSTRNWNSAGAELPKSHRWTLAARGTVSAAASGTGVASGSPGGGGPGGAPRARVWRAATWGVCAGVGAPAGLAYVSAAPTWGIWAGTETARVAAGPAGAPTGAAPR